MKPVVSAFNAWSWCVPTIPSAFLSNTWPRPRADIHPCSVVVSVFAIIILSALGGLYRNKHEQFTGGTEDPKLEDAAGAAESGATGKE